MVVVAPMWFIAPGAAGPYEPIPCAIVLPFRKVAAGPASLISRCGIMSLFTTTIEAPRCTRMVCEAANALPLYDQLWQPRTWWRMTSAPDGFAAALPATAATATAAASAMVRFISDSFLDFRGVSAPAGAAESAVAHRRAA